VTLASLLWGSLPGLRLNEHLAHDGESVFRHACKLGFEGIVSKRLGSPYRSGRSRHWVKMKNPACAALKRGMMMAQPQREDDDRLLRQHQLLYEATQAAECEL
jgi:ATP-dependent DNA ligase